MLSLFHFPSSFGDTVHIILSAASVVCAVSFFLNGILLLLISRIRRNLSIHIARFSASESLRAYTNIYKNSPYSLVARASLLGGRLRV